jgi:hypothetical protein
MARGRRGSRKAHRVAKERERTGRPSSARHDAAKEFTKSFDDLPDGAFFALAGEQGIELEDFDYDDE